MEDFKKFTGRKKKLWELRQKMVSISGTSKNYRNIDGLKVKLYHNGIL